MLPIFGALFFGGLALSTDEFVSNQRGIALQGALNNIGPNGTKAKGAAAGIVVASPSQKSPPYFASWTRDSAVTVKMIIEEYKLGKKDLGKHVEDYIRAQAVLQTTTNPSGALLPSGLGLGEAKFNVDGSRFNPAWGRPQRDGPALRAIALIDYSWALIDEHGTDKVKEAIWPIIQNDLSYTGQYWNQTGFDLWEEVNGSSFFTTQNQYRALIEGAHLAEKLGVKCTGCDQAPAVLCFLQSYWNGEYFVANQNLVYDAGRTGIDASTILGSISVFDVEAACDSLTLQPCNSKSLANFKVVVDTFRNDTFYPINKGINGTRGVAMGRYAEDNYFGGNPWYLITLGAAEFLYDAAASWARQGQIVVDKTSLPFFKEVCPGAKAGETYTNTTTSKCLTHGTNSFVDIIAATTNYADSFVVLTKRFTPDNGSLSEQFSRTDGKQLSAVDLTWSYASFVTMSQRRAGEFSRPWTAAGKSAAKLPETCAASSTPGVYAPATAAGAPKVTISDLCTSTVQFQLNATTYYGENIFMVGSSPELGSWKVDNAQALSADQYSEQRPLWYVNLALSAGEQVSYIYVRQQNCDRGYVYDSINRTVTAPKCQGSGTSNKVLLFVDDAWKGQNTTGSKC